MKVLFAFNGRVEVDHHGNLFGNELNDTLVKRYSYFGEEVTFLVRKRLIGDLEKAGLTPFKSKKLQVIPLEEINNPVSLLVNNPKNLPRIDHAVSMSKIVIARLPGLIGRQAIHFAKKKNIPYLIEVVGCPWDALWNHSLLGKIYAPYAYLKLRKLLRNAPYVLYVTNEFLQKRYPSCGRSIGITDVILKPLDDSIKLNRIDRITGKRSGQPLIIGTLAAIDVKYKGHAYVIKAISKLNKRDSVLRFKYKIAGKGKPDYLNDLIKKYQMEEHIEIVGQIKHEEVYRFLDGLDLYVQPSKQEGLPRALIEAMSRGCCCIGSNAGGIPELLDNDLIFRKGDVNMLIEILQRVDRYVMEQQANRNFEFVKRFDTDILNNRRRSFYAELISSVSFGN